MSSSFRDVGVINYWIAMCFLNLCWWTKPRVRPQRLLMWLWSREILIYWLKNSKPPHSNSLDELFRVFFSCSPQAWELLKRQKVDRRDEKEVKILSGFTDRTAKLWPTESCKFASLVFQERTFFQYWSTVLPCFACFGSGGQRAVIGFLSFK